MSVVLTKPEMVLIDLDGTLVDSVPDLAWCVDETMKALNMPVRGEDKVRNWVGNGVPRLIQRALINQLDGEPSDTLYAEAAPIFMALYADNASKRSQLYPHVAEGLQWLKDAGIRLGCVTNKDEQFTLPILKDLGIYDYFEIVISGDTLPLKKPDPAPLLHGANFFGVKPENAMMIGDSISDVKASRAAGFSIVCMSYGYNHGVDIHTANPDVVIDTFAELKDLF
jgi:phosphoglycolate phosphatase